MSENCENCPVSVRVDSLEREFDRYRDSSSKTHSQMFERIGALESLNAVQENKLTNMDDKLDDIQTNQKSILGSMEELKSKPAKRWETLISGVISSVGTAFLMWIMMGMPGVGA